MFTFRNCGRRAPPPSKIVLGRGGNPVYVLAYLAEHHRLFAKHHLTVQIEDFPTGRDALSALIQGKVDLATGYQTPVLLRSLEGHSLRILTSFHSATQNTAVVGRKDRGILTPTDLIGKKIGLTFDTSAELFVALLLKANGVPFSKVKQVNIQPKDLVEALKQGQVDAICAWQPFLFNAQNGLEAGGAVTFYSDNYIEMSLLVGMEPALESKRTAIVAFLKSLAEAEEILRDDPQAAFGVVEKFFPTEHSSALRAGWTGIEPELKLDNLLMLTLEQEAELFRQQGRVRANKAQIREMIDTSFLTDAHSEAVTLLDLPVRLTGGKK